MSKLRRGGKMKLGTQGGLESRPPKIFFHRHDRDVKDSPSTHTVLRYSRFFFAAAITISALIEILVGREGGDIAPIYVLSAIGGISLVAAMYFFGLFSKND